MILAVASTPPLSLHDTHIFDPGPVHVGFVVNKLAVTLVFLLALVTLIRKVARGDAVG
jgi:hypothetical protein